jgi:hypothetical protein
VGGWRQIIIGKVTLGFLTDAHHVYFKSSLLDGISNCEEAMPWLRQLVADLSSQGPGLYPKPIHVGCVMGKLALGQLFSEYFRFVCQYYCFSAVYLSILVSLMLYDRNNL